GDRGQVKSVKKGDLGKAKATLLGAPRLAGATLASAWS
ncbi:unnamed protein product, partial [marine sediment metagenome]